MAPRVISRRRFLQDSLLLGATASLLYPRARATGRAFPDLAVGKGGSPAANCRAAVEALGGFRRFVQAGSRVVIKPNPTGNNPNAEAAIHTHPELIAAVVAGCLQAGAARVRVLSNDTRRSFRATGIGAAVERAGATWEALERSEQYREVEIPRGSLLGREAIAAEVLDADVFINMPIVKQSPEVVLTAAMKNLMGVNWDRMRFHRLDLNRAIAELAGAVHHDLTIVDANNVLLSNGPYGPGEVSRPGQVLATINPVTADAFAARYLGRQPEEIPHVRMAHELELAEIDLARLRIVEVSA